MKILFLTPYPIGESPSQRFRFEQYFTLLREVGFTIQVQPFLNENNWKIFYVRGNALAKVLTLINGFFHRFTILFSSRDFDYVFIHREVTPIGPPIFEWIIKKVLKKKIIYDFDDAIWLTDDARETRIKRFLKWRTKISHICRWGYKISAGNQYLADYAKQFNSCVEIIPTTIDTKNVHVIESQRRGSDRKMVIGWTGSHSTLKYLLTLEPVLKRIEGRFPETEFLVIANQQSSLSLKNLRFLPWSVETEIADLAKIDIGVMPLPEDPWTLGKCGFKALQYMAMGIPTIASPVGVNNKIIKHGVNGFLAVNDEQWENSLIALIEDKFLREIFGKAGRETVEKFYSTNSNSKYFLSLFN